MASFQPGMKTVQNVHWPNRLGTSVIYSPTENFDHSTFILALFLLKAKQLLSGFGKTVSEFFPSLTDNLFFDNSM